MCKVFAMTNTTQFKVNTKFLSIVRNEVCRHADQDGFGYAVLSKDGNIGGERTIRPLNFRPLIDPEVERRVDTLPIVLKANNGFGVLDLDNAKSVIAHGRLSTNTISLENTHPFTNGEVALIHNGVVTDPTSGLKNLTSTCDSEILMRYWERGGVEQIEKYVSGYYAVALVDKSGLLHIVRDDRADLFISYCKTVDSFIIATTSEIIRNVAKEMKWKIEHPEEILEKTYTVFDSNDIISHREITPRTFGTYGGAGAWEGNHYSRTRDATSSSQIEASKSAVSSVYSKPKTVGYHEQFEEGESAVGPIPNQKELPGRVAEASSMHEATLEGIVQEEESRFSAERDTSVDESSSSGGLTLNERVELITEEVNDWRAKRAGNDV